MEKQKVRLIAFFLPQFHPIPENDEWWGKGFTEWVNVKKAKPLFPGHYQPHIPGELGYYNLCDHSAREAQASLAREYGIHGFCYYHYWFNGRCLLGHPFDEVLSSGKPDFPFCLCWANENWTRRWDGRDKDILIEQRYSEMDDKEHIRWLMKAFKDDRYIRVNGKPIFLVYRANRIADPVRTTSIWREEARCAGIGELFLCKVESFPDEFDLPGRLGFDAAVQFHPTIRGVSFLRRFLSRSKGLVSLLGFNSGYLNNGIYCYDDYVRRIMSICEPAYKEFPCVMPGWDNSPRRRKNATIFIHNTPETYGRWLKSAIESSLKSFQGSERLVFINAWNEWGEGNHLEPCQKWGRAYLEATRDAVLKFSEQQK
ncbi:MAG: glycoside hydrolase family 99-like domain-containing protein [Candidatus Omnitrophota bacterium]